MWRDLGELAIDVALVAGTIEYADWLAEHKQLEPDWTWLEVAFGTALCLVHSAALGSIRGGDWRIQQWRVLRSFALGAAPVVLGEMRQYRHRQEERRRYFGLRA
jgi:hypothetical protein